MCEESVGHGNGPSQVPLTPRSMRGVPSRDPIQDREELFLHSFDCNRRILIVDDNESIHDDIRAILEPQKQDSELDALSEALFDTSPSRPTAEIKYSIDSAYQGQDGLVAVEKALESDQPYALAIVDVRMPPGWDGIQTIEAIRRVDKEIQIAICTAYSDYSWQNILDSFGINDWLLILKKPFDIIEVKQLACSLTEKWSLSRRARAHVRELEESVLDQAAQLKEANEALQLKIISLEDANVRLAHEMEARRLADDRIRHIAYHDALTQLPNRMLLQERIRECIDRSKRKEDYRFAVLYCDVDKFKIVNDSLGHGVGDLLLVRISERLLHALRCSSRDLRPAADMVSRLSGDEFVVLLDDVRDIDQACSVAERVSNSVSQPTQIAQNELRPAISIGIAISSGEYDDACDLLRDADIALYHAKKQTDCRISVFDTQMRTQVTDRMNLENDLQRAIKERQFVVYYQPIVSLTTGDIVSVEALVRWKHPQRGILSPDAFIVVAEETGMIEPIGELVLCEALRQVRSWRTDIPGAENLGVNVNLSPRQLANKNLAANIESCLKRTNTCASILRLEITETAMMSDLDLARRIIHQLVELGAEIHLDDFGTGYSSLSILHTLPFSTIKLDRSFVGNLSNEIESPTTVQALVMLADCGGFNLLRRELRLTSNWCNSENSTVNSDKVTISLGPYAVTRSKTSLSEEQGRW